MSKDKLIVEPDGRDSDHHRLVWWIAEYEDIGGTLGDDETLEREALNDPKLSSEDRECVIAYLAAKSLSSTKRDSYGFYWESRKEASGALRVVNAAIKNDGGAPWPAWTKVAIAAGWKAPKGWKP